MTAPVGEHAGEPIAYMQRTRSYYAALGYAPYQWATFPTVPFARAPSVAAVRLVLITTAARFDRVSAIKAPARFTTPVRSSIRCIEYRSTRRRICASRTSRTIGPYHRRRSEYVVAGERLSRTQWRSGRDRIAGERRDRLPTDRSQRATQERDAPAALAACRELQADVALLVPNCPVCHQSVSLVSRHLEANGNQRS